MARVVADPRQTKFVLDEDRGSRAPGTTSPPTCPSRRAARSAPGHGPADRAGRPRAALPDGADQAGRQHRTARSRSRSRSATRTGSTGRARSIGRTGSRSALDTPAHIYYKYEGGSPSGSHKPNTALAQAFYNKEEGVTRLATETGAGQWGSALAFAGAAFGLEVKVYMVRASYDQKPYRRILMETYGAQVVASPSRDTEYGRKVLAETPDHTGSLGIAISEAIEDTVTHPGTKYSLGSVFDFVLLHQTVIGQESIEQMAMAGEEPDVIIGCAGGGSNFAGLTFPWLGQTFRGGREVPRHRGRARGGAVADPRRLRLRLRRHGEDDAAREDAHARLATSSPSRSTPAACATTAWRRSCRTAQGARRDRGPQRPPARELRGRRPVRPGRGDPARARADPRPQGRDRRGARRQARRARSG